VSTDALGASPRGTVVPFPSRARRPRVASSGVIGMMLFVIAETMFFAGLVSAFTIVRTTALTPWPPPNQPRLPIESTAVNTLALLVSGVVLLVSSRHFARDAARAVRWLALSAGLGAFFVVFQGAEWVALLAEGLTMKSSTHGAFFYLIVGAHGLHALAALGGLCWALLRARRGTLAPDAFATVRVFWYFVVALWPLLYWRVYL